jgi:hypothetical protein
MVMGLTALYYNPLTAPTTNTLIHTNMYTPTRKVALCYRCVNDEVDPEKKSTNITEAYPDDVDDTHLAE